MSKEPAPLVPAATILLLRQHGDDMQVFMVVRHHQIDFASGALVFPGGKTDPQDSDPKLDGYLRGASDDPDRRAIEVSAIREAFEECGVLLARPKDEDALIDGARLATLDPVRAQLVDGSVKLADFLERENLELAIDTLTHFAHWLTPTMMPKRFDTHFIWREHRKIIWPLHDGSESVDSVWISPSGCLAGAEDGRYTVIFPTPRNIWKLGQYASVDDAIKAANAEPTVPVLPVLERREDGAYLTIPAEAGYDIVEEKMPDRPS